MVKQIDSEQEPRGRTKWFKIICKVNVCQKEKKKGKNLFIMICIYL